MAARRPLWVHAVAALAGGLALGVGVARLVAEGSLWGSVLAVLGFLVIGWAVLDRRRSRPGTPESEVGGGHTIE